MVSSDLINSILSAFDKASAGYIKLENAHSKIEATKKVYPKQPALNEPYSQEYADRGLLNSAGIEPPMKDRKEKEHFHDIKSLNVGFVHRKETGDDRTIIKLRELVKKGQVLAYIRSMNIMHDVVSDIDGKVIEVLVEDGQAVEYGQPLFRLKLTKRIG